ncbi:MAG: GNAT family N-acetyltransferase [Pseudomonadota bacterium]
MSRSLTDQDAAHWLDNPVWSALSTRHRRFALVDGRARRMIPEIGPFAALPHDDAREPDALARLVAASGSGITLMKVGKIEIPDALPIEATGTGVQMIARSPMKAHGPSGIEPLGLVDMKDMLALTDLTKPGPFKAGTHKLGQYWGVRVDGRLVAMAGERLKQPGFTEVSAVCVHPDHRGKGLGARLTTHVAAAIQARGECAYLHAVAENVGAIRLYEKLGFRVRCEVQLAWLLPPSGRVGSWIETASGAPQPLSASTPSALA